MSAPAFTSGPWVGVIHGDSEMGDTFHLGPEGDEYAGPAFTILEGGLVQADDAENEANANLIAAAPELYEALERITDCYGVGMSAEAFCEAVKNFMLEGRAALSKARGESPSTQGADDVK